MNAFLNEIVNTTNIERSNGKLYNYMVENPSTDFEVDPNKVVYPNASLKLARKRKCYCYTGLHNEYPPKRSLVRVIKASNGTSVTNEDMVKFFESDSGKKFTSACNHAYMEDLFPTGKPHEYEAYFGS